MTTLLALAGAAAIVVGCAYIAPWLALIVGGSLAIVTAVALELSTKRPEAAE